MAATAMDGKIALVTGGGAGIGEACVHALRDRGATVVVADISREAAERVAGEAGGGATAVTADMADEGQVRAMIEGVVADHGRLDVAVNNAGIGGDQVPTGEYPVESWRKVLSVNLDGVFLCMRHELPAMVANGGGAIVNMASISGLAGDPGWGAYNAAKAAVINMTQSLAWEVGRYGIRANAICPGPIGTERMLGSLESDPKMKAIYDASTPIRRIGTPEECAAAILFLASDDASFVNATTLVCDGGLTGATGQPRFDLDSYSFDGGN
jgi:meso-butanediol dehydrogenase/(S,S)-butanediol dehydrogenase/diacetyl reductase